MKSEVLQLSRFALHSALSVVKVGAESGSEFDLEAKAGRIAILNFFFCYIDRSTLVYLFYRVLFLPDVVSHYWARASFSHFSVSDPVTSCVPVFWQVGYPGWFNVKF